MEKRMEVKREYLDSKTLQIIKRSSKLIIQKDYYKKYKKKGNEYEALRDDLINIMDKLDMNNHLIQEKEEIIQLKDDQISLIAQIFQIKLN